MADDKRHDGIFRKRLEKGYKPVKSGAKSPPTGVSSYGKQGGGSGESSESAKNGN